MSFTSENTPQKKIDQTEILDVKQPNDDEADVAIISGEAGAGKTTLLRLILELWSKGKTENFPKLSDYDTLIYIQLRDRDYDSLDAYIEHILNDVVKDFGLNIVKSSLLNSRCLFLLDGYDEINEKSTPILEEILKLPQAKKIVVTTRPINTTHLTCKVEDKNNTRVNLSLSGMTEEKVLESIEILVNKHESNEDKRKEVKEKLIRDFHSMPPAMKQLTKTPLYNSLIIVLSMETQDCKTFDTVTKLYEEVTKYSLKELVKKIGSQEAEKVQEFYKVYCHRSLKNLLCNKLELDKEDIEFFETECERLKLPFEDVMSAFFNTKHKLSPLDLKPIFCYRHTTEQEFAAAHGICDILKKHNSGTHETEENIISYYLKKEFPQEYHEGEENENKVEDKEEENKVEEKEDENMVEDKEDENKVEDEEDEGEADEDEEDEDEDDEDEEDEGEADEDEEDEDEDDEDEEDEYKNDEDVEYEAENKDTRLHNVFPFLAGILVNSKLDDERFINCLIKLVIGVDIDQFLHILSESIESNNVIKAIVRRLSAEGADVWKVKDGRNLSYLRPLLLNIRPKKIILVIREDPATFPDLKPALEAISSRGIVLSLNLFDHFYADSENSDEYFKVAKTLKFFKGSLSSKVFPLIKDELKFLKLAVQEKHLTQLIKSAKNLSYLELWIHYEEDTCDDHPLCPLLYDGKTLNIIIVFDGGGEGEGKSCARKLNQLWPRLPIREESPPPKKPKLSLKESEGDELRCGEYDVIDIFGFSFSKDDIEEFIKTLQMKRLRWIDIETDAVISEENIQHLQTLAEEIGCTSRLSLNRYST